MTATSSVSVSLTRETTLELTQDDLRLLIARIEASLYRSGGYLQVLGELQKASCDSTQVEQLLRVAAKAAIVATLRRILRQYKTAARPKPPHAPNGKTARYTQASPAPLQPHSQAETSDRVGFPCHAPEWEEKLEAIGDRLQKTRTAIGFSQEQLHRQTYVPLHHLKAIERGDGSELPEDVYVRGFIRLLGYTLGLDGQALADSLPRPTAKTLPPARNLPKNAPKAGMAPAHLYLGYTALVAGAIGGLSWLAEQPDLLEDVGATSVEEPTAPEQSHLLEPQPELAPPESF